MKDKVSGAIAIPKASWECAPALPNQIQVVFLEMKFPITSRRQLKVFRCSSFSKMLPRCGRAAHICEANSILQSVFPAAIACFKTFKFRQSCIMSVKVVNSDKATGQLQHAGRQKQGWNPLLPDAENRFP